MARPRKTPEEAVVSTTPSTSDKTCKNCVFFRENALKNMSVGYCGLVLPPGLREFQNRATHGDETCSFHKEK